MGRKRKLEGDGVKEMFNNSRLGKTVNGAVKRHESVIDAIRQDPSVHNFVLCYLKPSSTNLNKKDRVPFYNFK